MALTGFIINNECVATAAEAANHLMAPYPLVSGQYLVEAWQVAYSPPQSFTVSLVAHDLTTAGLFDYSHVLNLSLCDPAISLLGGTVFDPLVGAAYWSFSMTFIFGVFLVARNAGEIIDAIKRF